MTFAVAPTEEYARVAALPRRRACPEVAQQWADYFTAQLALRPGVALRRWQGLALAEAQQCGGAWLALPVGQGKTLISALLPTVLRSARSLLIVPGSLASKTFADYESYVRTWRLPASPIRIETREKLAVDDTALTHYAPDLIVIDEADDLANIRASVPRKIDRYVRANPHVRVVAMTATPARKSLLGYWHILAWCLGNGAPLPLTIEEARLWALALDDHRGRRPELGPLGGTLEEARAWYSRRLIETPGCLVVDEDSCDAPLRIRVRIADEDPILNEAFDRFLVEQENPGGIPVSTPLSRWLLDGQLGLGLYTRWNPPPPEEWRLARRAVARFVRERIDASTHTAHPIDTEAGVLRRYPSHPIVVKWREQKPLFAGETEAVWISRSALDYCLRWLRSLGRTPGIVWSGSVDFGEALAREAGLAYYGPKGRTASGSYLHAAPRDRSLVCSWGANKKGQNLQPWSRQLITLPPQSAKWLEQIIGRSHRAGQQEPVIVDVLATSGGTLDLFETAISEAGYGRDTLALTQKILRADIERESPRLTSANELRWARKG